MNKRIMRKRLVFGIIFLCIGTNFVSAIPLTETKESKPMDRGTWLYVGGSGPGNYTTIQSAINAADSDDIIFVYNGIYFEHLSIGKSLTLFGEEKNSTIIDGGGTGDCIYIDADRVNISGFTIQHSGSVLWVDTGIEIYSGYNIITDNSIIYNGFTGITLDGSSYNTISRNIVNYNGDDAIVVYYSEHNNISNNIVDSNAGDGINVKLDSNHNIVSWNYIANNQYDAGIALYDSGHDNFVYGNTIENQFQGINSRFSAYNNSIYHNNFINDTRSFSECDNIWYNTTLQEGNYWTDYTGIDADGDGIGDVPYNIEGGDNQDLYPLMHPFGTDNVLDILLENPEVNEGTFFNITIIALSGIVVPDAFVEFNNETKTTDSNGTVWFTAPQVENDTFYNISATKEGYISAYKTVLVKDVPSTIERTVIFGRIANRRNLQDVIMFEAVMVRVVTFSPFSVAKYLSGELFTIPKNYQSYVGLRYIFAILSNSSPWIKK